MQGGGPPLELHHAYVTIDYVDEAAVPAWPRLSSPLLCIALPLSSSSPMVGPRRPPIILVLLA